MAPAVRALVDAAKVGLLLAVAVLLQVTLVVDIRVIGGTPNLVLVVVVALALLRGPVPGALAAFVGGFLVDALGPGVLGASSLTLVVAAYAAGVWGESVPDTAPVRPLLVVAVMSLLADIGSLVVAVLLDRGPAIGTTLVAGAVPAAMMNLLIAIALYPLVRRLLAGGGRGPIIRPVRS
jgi:rod shape-determining protein MreD